MNLADVLSWLVSLALAPLLLAWVLLALYLLFLTVSALVARTREGKNPALAVVPTTRFSILVPAHNEEVVIEECLGSLTQFDYPADMRRVIVIADNCTDDTPKLAANKGAIVYERTNDKERGKGYALDWALKKMLSEDGGWTDAVLVFDADTVADANFLRYMDAKLQKGSLALQGQYNLHNPFDNWRTALLYSALLLTTVCGPWPGRRWVGPRCSRVTACASPEAWLSASAGAPTGLPRTLSTPPCC